MKKIVNISIISVFILLYLITSIISTIHSIDFFELSNTRNMSIFLAIAFEIGAAASLASIIVYNKMNKYLVWLLFITLTLFQVVNNIYYSFVHLDNFDSWSQLFNIHESDNIFQMRIISIISGGVLPLIALGFIKSLVDYLKPTDNSIEIDNITNNQNNVNIIQDTPNENEIINQDNLTNVYNSVIDKDVEELYDLEKPKKNLNNKFPHKNKDDIRTIKFGGL